MKKLFSLTAIVFVVAILSGCKSISLTRHNHFSQFIGTSDFSTFSITTNQSDEVVILTPQLKSCIQWNELIVSWNAAAPFGSFVKIEAAAIAGEHQTKFYTIAEWSPDGKNFPRTSVRGQKDNDGTVDIDTLILNQSADAAQIRVTLGGKNGVIPSLKFLGLSFANTKQPVTARKANRAAWGKIISTPEHSQHGYPNAKGWCSPTSLSMALSRWSQVLNRPEMDLTVPEVAAKVYDDDFKGTGNWPFNTALAGSFTGMRAYVTRLDDLREVEDWIAAGIPVILSARWDWLLPGRPLDKDGHLIVCIGFTKEGDVIINDPATRFDKGEVVRRIYKRADVMHSWTKSHNAVYLVYPVGAKIPANKYGHWEN